MAYYPDLEKISLDEYKSKLAIAWLPPSRRLLKERLDERFAHFESAGISNVRALIQFLRKKEHVAQLARIECLQGDYLTILLRELNSLHPKPNKLADFRGISAEVIEKLERVGINNTEKLYERVRTKADRKHLADKTGLSLPDVETLTRLTDLSRIKWAGATFARMLYDLGVDTAARVAQSDPVELHNIINLLNQQQAHYKGQIGLNDIRIFVEAAREVPIDIEY